MTAYTGTIIRESFRDPALVDALPIVAERESSTWGQLWHLVTVSVSDEQLDVAIPGIQRSLEQNGRWYVGLKNGREHVVIFADAVFRFAPADARGRQAAVAHGLKRGISLAQLDF